jgi:hypothetical protein
MTNFSGHIMMASHAVRGHISNLVINTLFSLATDLAEVTDDDDFYCVLTLHVQISSIETSLNGYITRATLR